MRNYPRLLGVLLLLTCFSFATQAQNENFQLRSSISYPGQTLANVCGWTAPDGSEYALVGASKGMAIVDITNPDMPVQIVQIPGPDNLWKEIKTYSHYAYVTSEGGGGVQIVDLSALPSPDLQYHNYNGTGAINGQLDVIHALHIDVNKGILYTYGGGFQVGVAHDLNQDPYNPEYVGRFDGFGYIHDGYAENDTLYACHIYSGLLSIVDMTDKQNPVILGSIQTPGKFTHNSWLLSDHKYIITTDEEYPSFVTSYDISDPTDIKELDRFSIDNGSGSIGHNVQVINDYTVTSWYTGGVVITDCHRPENLVQTARYDTWAGGGKFDGCWGAFPYFPSGTVIASNIDPGELFILTPDYKRACYLEGIVKNSCDGTPLVDVKVEILGGSATATTLSKPTGVVKTGQVNPGTYTIQFSKAGYTTQTMELNLAPGEVATFDITMDAGAAFTVSGLVADATSGTFLPNVPVTLSNGTNTYNLVTGNDGTFSADCVPAGTYAASAGVWGYISAASTYTVNQNTSIGLALEKGYADNFENNLGWTTTATASAGLWERGEPIGTNYQGQQSNPEFDVTTDTGDQCYVTGNGGGQVGADDVDNGGVTLITPVMELGAYADAVLTFDYWFFNSGGSGTPNDYFEVRASNGSQEVVILTTAISNSGWISSPEIHLADYITLNDQVKISFYTADDEFGNLVEAAVDAFVVTPVIVSGIKDLAKNLTVAVTPNPTVADFQLTYNWPGISNSVVRVTNATGQIIYSAVLNTESGNLVFGTEFPAGIYTVQLFSGQSGSRAIQVVKQ